MRSNRSGAPRPVRWGRVLLAWFAIAAAETVHGILRGLLLVPVVGDLPARQIGVAVGSAIVFAIALLTVRWMGLAPGTAPGKPLQVGVLWVVLTVAFELSLGVALGYSRERILSDYDPTAGGYMGLGLLLMLVAPALAARLRAPAPRGSSPTV